MYLIGQIWWLLLIAFFIGALAGYLVWRGCARPRLESRFAREKLELADQVRHLERKLNSETAAPSAAPRDESGAAIAPSERTAESVQAATPPAPRPAVYEQQAAEAHEPAALPKSDIALFGDRASSDGKTDNLKLIRGIGPRLEKILNSMGIYRFDQIANWTPDDLAVVDRRLGDFSGRAVRDKWIEQSRHLLAGGSSPKSGKYTH